MCGIVGVVGKAEAPPLLLEALRRLEYRGYDSAGVAAVNGGMEIVKTRGKLRMLEDMLEAECPEARLAVAHTRWATHGAPSSAATPPWSPPCGSAPVPWWRRAAW